MNYFQVVDLEEEDNDDKEYSSTVYSSPLIKEQKM